MNNLVTLQNAGFTVSPRKLPRQLPPEIRKRYPNIPPQYIDFLNQFGQITNPDQTTWFNMLEDFYGETETDFPWNAFEQMSIEWMEDDQEEIINIRRFWDNHLPILISVTQYQYLAICLESNRYGEIVHGAEPEFEDTTKVCDNFQQLITLFENPSENSYLRNLL